MSLARTKEMERVAGENWASFSSAGVLVTLVEEEVARSKRKMSPRKMYRARCPFASKASGQGSVDLISAEESSDLREATAFGMSSTGWRSREAGSNLSSVRFP